MSFRDDILPRRCCIWISSLRLMLPATAASEAFGEFGWNVVPFVVLALPRAFWDRIEEKR